MAIGDDYITVDELRAYMALDADLYADVIAGVVSSTSREIEDYCHRQFNDSGAATARTYKANRDSNFIAVDDFSTTDELVIAVNGTVLTADQYELTPENGMRNGVPGYPYWGIRITDHLVSTPRPWHRLSVAVTARWGWAAVPSPVMQAAFILAADTFQMKDVRHGVAGNDQWGVVRVRENNAVSEKLKRYTRQRVFVA